MASCNPIQGERAVESLKGLENIFKMLSCVKCGNQLQKEVYRIGPCEHKYCESCVSTMAGNRCTVCGQTSAAKEAVTDGFTTKLLAGLRVLETALKNREQNGQKDRGNANNSPSLTHDDDEQNALEDQTPILKKLDYHTKSRLSPQKGSPTGEKAVRDQPGISSEEEDELLSLDVKCDSPSSKEGLQSLNISKLKRVKRRISQIVSSDDENDDFAESKNMKAPMRSLRTSSSPAVKTPVRIVSSTTRNSNAKRLVKSVKGLDAVNPKKIDLKKVTTNKDQNDLDVDLFEFEAPSPNVMINDKEKVESPPCLTPYVKVSKTSDGALRSISKSSNLQKGAGKPVLAKGKKQKNGSNEKTVTRSEKDEGVENGDTKEDTLDNFDFNDGSPPALTPYGKAKPTESNKETSSVRKSKRVAAIGNAETPKSNEKGYSETPKPEKKRPRKTLLNPLQTSNLKTPDTDEPHRTRTPMIPQGQSETTTTPKEVRRSRKHSSSTLSSVGSSTVSLASTSFSSASSVDKRNAKGETPLHIFCRTGNLEKVRQLITAGADLNAQDHAGWTPLHEALNEKNACRFEVVSLLCLQGCNTNIPGMDNEFALHEAARAGYVEIVQLLLSHSASPNVRNSSGKLPRDVATAEEVKNILDEASGYKPGNDPVNSPSSDDPVVLEIQFSKALIYFNYTVPRESMNSVQTNLKLKVSKQLKEGVTHIIFPIGEEEGGSVKVPFSFEYLFAVGSGVWTLSSKWIEESLSAKRLLPPKPYEVQGCMDIDQIDAPTKARMNKEVGNPGLFHGMSFYLYKSCYFDKISKKELVKLIIIAEGKVINREPNPESVDPLETPVRFHATEQNHKFVLTSHVILFNGTDEPPTEKKYNLEHLKVLNVKWLIDSIGSFKLLDPHNYL